MIRFRIFPKKRTLMFSLFDMDSDESYHSESATSFPGSLLFQPREREGRKRRDPGNEVEWKRILSSDEITNDNEEENIGAINKENQQNVNVFTMTNMQNYILAQREENTV